MIWVFGATGNGEKGGGGVPAGPRSAAVEEWRRRARAAESGQARWHLDSKRSKKLNRENSHQLTRRLAMREGLLLSDARLNALLLTDREAERRGGRRATALKLKKIIETLGEDEPAVRPLLCHT